MLTGDRQLIKELNVTAVITAIREHQPISRVGIAELTGLSKSTVTAITQLLLDADLVRETGSGNSRGGRRPTLLQLTPTARLAVGVKIAPEQVTAALISLTGQILNKEVEPLPDRVAEIVTTIDRLVRRVVNDAGFAFSPDRLLGVGVGLPGIVDPATGSSISSHFLRWHDVPIKRLLEERLGLSVYPENDANCFALGEYWYGAGRGVSSLLGVTVGIGIGAGLILDGRIYRGPLFGAGEIGHMIVQRDGPACACGRHGCLEALAGDAAIVRYARLHKGEPAAYPAGREDVVRAAIAHDPHALHALAEAGEWIGLGLANLVNTVSTDFIVVGGEAATQAGELLLDPIRSSLQRHVFPSLADRVRIVPAALGDEVWLIGATVLALQHFFRAPLAKVGARTKEQTRAGETGWTEQLGRVR